MKKNEKRENSSQNETFLEKMKDKKFSAKVQLIGYGVLIVFLIIYANIASYESGSVSDNTVSSENKKGDSTIVSDGSNLFGKIDKNYEYEITLDVSMKDVMDATKTTLEHVLYKGKKYEDNMIIDIIHGDNSLEYYQVGKLYYQFQDGNYAFVSEDEVYSLVGVEYLSIDSLREYIDLASLDHVSDYSSGKKEYVYHLKVNSIVRSYEKDDLIDISVMILDNVVEVTVDYTNLLGLINQNVIDCKVQYRYFNINQVEEFTIID